jgi:hypothetical protein
LDNWWVENGARRAAVVEKREERRKRKGKKGKEREERMS